MRFYCPRYKKGMCLMPKAKYHVEGTGMSIRYRFEHEIAGKCLLERGAPCVFQGVMIC